MLIDLIKKNRSYRRFDESKTISNDEILELLEAARLSSSAANLQTLRFYVADDQVTKDCIFPHLKWAGYLRYWDGPIAGERPSAYILILAPAVTTQFHHIDTGIVAQSILLSAAEKDMGGCMIASVDKTAVHANLKLPEDLSIVLAIAIGYPAESVIIEDVIDPDDIEYWRDDEGVHHVPKRALADLIID